MVETVSRPGAKTKNGRAQYRNGVGRRLRSAQRTYEQEQIAKERRRWEETTVAGSLGKMPERVPPDQFTTISGERIERIYTPADLPGFDYMEDLGFPGEYPYTRGNHPTMYRSRFWTMRMFAGFGSV